MTREEEIYEAAESFCAKANPQLLVGDYSFIQGAEWADNHPKLPWISVKDKLPPKENCELSIKVLVVSTKNEIYFRRYDYNMKRWLCPIPGAEFTHWRLLPEPPKERR